MENRLLICSDCGFRAKAIEWTLVLEGADIKEAICPECKGFGVTRGAYGR